VSETFLPIATTDQAPDATIPLAAAISDLADVLSSDSTDPTNVRFGAVTSISDPLTQGRVQVDITSTAWLSRSAGVTLKVGDRVWLLQQGPISIVGGRVNGGDASPIGMMAPFAGSSATVPSDWAACDGSSLLRAGTYAALYAVIGVTYGSVDGTHFNLPNMVNKIPVGSGGTYARGDTGGAATVTLSTGQMPSHGHSLSGLSSGSAGSHGHSLSGSIGSVGDHSHSDSFGGSRSDLLAGGGSGAATSGGGSTGSAGGHSHSMSGSADSGGSHSHSVSGSADNTGGGGSHENMPPFVAVPWIIRVS
jgi:microcystin-dependent protein